MGGDIEPRHVDCIGHRDMVKANALLHVVVVGCCFLPSLLKAQDASYDGRPVVEIRYDPQVQPLAPKDLARLLPVTTGKPLQGADVRQAIKRLYATGEYADI